MQRGESSFDALIYDKARHEPSCAINHDIEAAILKPDEDVLADEYRASDRYLGSVKLWQQLEVEGEWSWDGSEGAEPMRLRGVTDSNWQG